ncbi:MAG: type I-D CRISPR-associated protein Cas7/Csc2 [Rubrobacteraceae bacterium]
MFQSGISREFEKDVRTVIVAAVLETTGQTRFGDGTDINITVTEKDLVSGEGGGVEKAVFAGTKRRGVDRRAMHELRNKFWDEEDCYIPKLCGMCPTCMLLGFTGTTQDKKDIKDINCKSRILYATAYSIQPTGDAINTHTRNQVNERSQTTAGSAGIHTEEVIVAGTHFPTYTTLHHVLDWEIGAFAHALLENVNQGRYTAASRAQGGMKIAEGENREPMISVDVSEVGIFPIPTPKVSAAEENFDEVADAFKEGGDEDRLKGRLERFGFSLEEEDGAHVWKRNGAEGGRRYTGEGAVSYLRKRQGDFTDFLATFKDGDGSKKFREGAKKYYDDVKSKKGSEE